MITLYQYLHCPYCIRVRMVLGYLKIPYESVILHYSDEDTPIRYTGKKMAPFIKKEDGTYLNESLEIIEYLDKSNIFRTAELKTSAQFNDVEKFLNKISPSLFNLLMPYYLNGIEFNEEDRKYFKKKKEIKRGPFELLVKRREEFTKNINDLIDLDLLPRLNPFFESTTFSLCDLIIGSHLWGLYLAYDFRISDQLHQYLQSISNKCNFKYDKDLWTLT